MGGIEKQMMLLNEMEIFYHVVMLNSFSRAADKLQVSKAFVSKCITRLERSLRARLLTRSTRTLALTEAGEIFYRYCSTIVHEAEQSRHKVQELRDKPAGVLTISMPPAIGLHLLAPLLPQFLQQYPDVSLNIQLEHKTTDIVAAGYDLALRATRLKSSNLHVQKIGMLRTVVCATPGYYQRHGMPHTPEELVGHNVARYSHAKLAQPVTFVKDAVSHSVMLQGNFVSSHVSLLKLMALQDICLAVVPEYVVSDELRDGQLVACVPDYRIPAQPLYAIYPERELMPIKLKAFLALLKTFLQSRTVK